MRERELSLTPIRRQYLAIKRRFPHAIVFFRIGDFYETFDDDAKLCARELEITLTSKPMGKHLRVPLAGVPHHAVDTYVAKLVAKGYKVAICDEMGDPATSRGLVEREVVRVVTPGTVLDDNLLDQRQNNYLAALVVQGDEAGLAYADISTGEFATTQLPTPAVEAELTRLRPAELLLPEHSSAPPTEAPITRLEAFRFDPHEAVRLLCEHFGVVSLDAFGCGHLPLAIAAAGALISYVHENQRGSLANFTGLTTYNATGFMVIDPQTRRNLELYATGRDNRRDGSLLEVLDFTKTAMGARLLRRWLGQPLLDVRAIRERQDAVDVFFSDGILRAQVQGLLAKIVDLERTVARTIAGSVQPRELVALARSLSLVPEIKAALTAAGGRAAQLAAAVPECPGLAALITAAIADDPAATFEEGGVIRDGFSSELDSLRSLNRDARRFLADLERRERERTGIRSLKVGYNKVFGYYIEVSNAALHLVPDEYQRRQTLSGAERFITPELKAYETQVLTAKERIAELEAALFRQVCTEAITEAETVRTLAAALAEVDVYAALAEAAVRYDYVRPVIDDSDVIEVRDGRHPVVERFLDDGRFVPNDTRLANGEEQILIITGPNMAGKSTYLRQVALIVLLGQVGSFVPAKAARIGVVDRIFTRVGAQDDLAAGRSTFMVEMLETASILHTATPRSLIILDEIGRGTSTYDGLAIAQAVVEYLHNRSEVAAKTLFATHYHELVRLADTLPRVRNANVAVTEEGGRVVFLYKIVPGGADRSYGIHVAELAGLPRPVIERARDLLVALERQGRNGVTPSPDTQREAPGDPALLSSSTRPGSLRPLPRRGRPAVIQLAFFGDKPPLLEELANLDVEALSPQEALEALLELRRRAREA